MALKQHSDNPPPGGSDSHDQLRHAIQHAAHLLPAQGPITVFIHHNTLHAFEDRPFDVAVQHGAKIFGCEPYLREERFRAELAKGRIRREDLQGVLAGEADATRIDGLTTRRELRLTMLENSVAAPHADELAYHLAESEALSRFRDDVAAATKRRVIAETRRWVMREARNTPPATVKALLTSPEFAHVESWSEGDWEAFTLRCLWAVIEAELKHAESHSHEPAPPSRHRDRILHQFGVDTDVIVNDLLARFAGTFVDQGISRWVLPDREAGFYRAFLKTYAQPNGPPHSWLKNLRKEAEQLLKAKASPLESAVRSLQALGVPPCEWEQYLSLTMLSLRGWGGIIQQMEQRGDRIAHPIPQGSLEEFVAVRLFLDQLAIQYVLTEQNCTLETLLPIPSPAPPTDVQRMYPIFQLAQLFGWTPEQLTKLTPSDWAALFAEVEAFHEIERRRIFHHAYERRFRIQTLDAISLHERETVHSRREYQVITCLDEREESFRRHLEEVAPNCETFGAPGFFAVVMYYRGVADAHFVPLCPIVVRPKHWVTEQVSDDAVSEAIRKARTRRVVGQASLAFSLASKSLAFGAILNATLGVLATIPLVGRVLFPRLAANWRRRVGEAVVKEKNTTRLRIERTTPEPAAEKDGIGYSLVELTDIAERLLRDIGLTHSFARMVFVLGHGSDSVNNPHKSAYDCGACGGSPGAPNGRALAQIINDPRVREQLAQRGISVPTDTWFVGGHHNTCNDSVILADVDRVPESHRADLGKIEVDFRETCDRNAHERSRRFMSAPLSHSTTDARFHVENRSEDLAQVRPELGHATNAIIVVGRRSRTRQLFLDRRAFLNSYDPTQDDADGTILARILSAAVPVCGGINLEYYFSHVDSLGYGCGTKLPHNITGLLGVMDGAASDLRTGLPWQMVEIHEPVRLLFVVETKPEVLLNVMNRVAVVGQMIRNGWVQLSVLDPESNRILVYQNGEFVLHAPTIATLPIVASSIDWYRGWRDHLEFAKITGEAHRHA